MGKAYRAACVAALLAVVAAAPARADFWKTIDRFDEREDGGIFSRANQKRADLLAIGGVVGLALWEGSETRLGRTAWQSMDAALMTAASTETLKRVFHRPRPIDNPDPGVWFAGSKNRSFPSGEVAMMAAFVTPFIREYHADNPGAWALAAIPLTMAKGRMAAQAHWLTDVVAGGAIGAGVGYYAGGRETPLVLSIGRNHAFVGLRYRFD
ncbi:phosphatase PAP2 family protein [Ramlibacter sp. AN1133]|uniref:phosphatase PAP2 family protein n=1 Tax=Ramlibacter sp. AN1133 TaxID=3133429 RepID=UPI0030BC9529